MTDYLAPLEEISFILRDIIGLDAVLEVDAYSSLSDDLILAVLDEAGKFANHSLAPLNNIGDRQGSHLKDGVVTTAEGFKEAYAEFIANGWNGVPFDPEYGGQGLPWLVSTAISEMWSGANMAFALCPLLTQGSVELLSHHGTKEQKEQYLPGLISGRTTGTMCLTEPQAGSDVGAITTKAIKDGDCYKITGQKIFITYGEHDFTENIIHMVLARVEDAPKGSKGISLFIVPKILSDGSRNDVKAVGIEHKLGIHASPTAVLSFGDNGGATGYLVGEENMGLKYMFTMMNNARLAVGIEGVALAENSYQKAYAYAQERVQSGSAIINHPDVNRMLLTIKSNLFAMRCMAYYSAFCIDKSLQDDSYKGLVSILIPVVKSYSTDMGFDSSSLAMQVFGGMGYIEETGIAQNLRDSRIAMIYEGTNGIQALDLVFRKIIDKDSFALLIEKLAEFAVGSQFEGQVQKSLQILNKANDKMLGYVSSDKDKASFVASYYLELFALSAGSCFVAKAASVDGYNEIAEFYMSKLLSKINYLNDII